jgi:hypothetical protein
MELGLFYSKEIKKFIIDFLIIIFFLRKNIKIKNKIK